MIDEQTAIQRLMIHEGLRLMPYRDHLGKLTIGVGRCIDTNPFTEQEKTAVGDWRHGITRNAAMMLLKNDIRRCLDELNRWNWYHELNDTRQYALLDMDFQLGLKKLKQFKKMLAALEAKDFETAYNECLNSVYAKQTPTRAERIAKAIKTGVWEC